MKRNGMCPVCYLKQFFTPRSSVTLTCDFKRVLPDAPSAPIMGWSSWNTFRNEIDEKLILDTAKALKEKGLLDAGYRYINLDDNWHSSLRTSEGKLQGDLSRFPRGIRPLFEELNAMGFRCGLYSSNGTLTCEDLPASLHREALDARTIASFGAEYLKYDFCHNEKMSVYAPLVYGIEIFRKGNAPVFYECKKARLDGTARFMPDRYVKCGFHVSGLDKNGGSMTYDNVYAEEDGEYILTVCVRKKGRYDKVLAARIGDELYLYDVPPQKRWNHTARFQKPVFLKKGLNTVTLFNPVGKAADSAFLQYYTMAKELSAAAKERPGEYKPIVFSVCEWGRNRPYKWAPLVGNMWRTTPDIRPIFPWIKIIYNHTVKLYKYASAGAWNDPDMLEVGNGKLTRNQNIAHFSLWCMMNAPLVLGNDIRSISEEVLSIVTQKTMLEIHSDPLYKPCKRIKKGKVDVLAKPLSDNRVAVLLFNKSKREKIVHLDVDKVLSDPYIDLKHKDSYCVKEVWSGEEMHVSDELNTKILGESVKVYIFG